MNAKTNGSMNEAEIQVLLDGWIQARRKVWDALFGLATANAPAPWLEFLERTGSYEQMVESLLQAQAAGVSTALRAFGAINAMQTTWGEGIQRLAATAADAQRLAATAADAQRKSGEEGARGAAKEAPASSKAAERSAAA